MTFKFDSTLNATNYIDSDSKQCLHLPSSPLVILSTMIPTVQTLYSCTSRPDSCQCLVVKTPMDDMSKNKPSTAMTHVACESKLLSVVMSSIHPCIVNWVAIGRAVVYYARATHTFSAGIKCRHCTIQSIRNTFNNDTYEPIQFIRLARMLMVLKW